MVALVGPTAVGKSRLALALAEHVPLEIVAADSRTVYRGLDVATAKPTPAERALVPHHLLDVVEPDEPTRWRCTRPGAGGCARDRGARPAAAGGRRRRPVCQRRRDGLVLPEVAPDPELRAALEARAAREGWQALQAELAAVDPTAPRASTRGTSVGSSARWRSSV